MQFRPCIDIHNGEVKQIVGSSLNDENSQAKENFVAKMDAAFYADFYQQRNISGGHVILLNKEGTPYFEATKEQALMALKTYPKGLQIGGGVNDQNAAFYLDQGAQKIIVTSYVFRDGQIDYENLEKLKKEAGKENIVLDLSCKKYEDGYYVMTDRWQKKTETKVTVAGMRALTEYCEEFLIHAVDVEGKANGIEEELAAMLGQVDFATMTYAGGVHNFDDLCKLKKLGNNRVNVTIGSALDLFGGNMKFTEVCDYVNQ